MIFYKTDRQDDPYIELWGRETWLHPIENADTMQFPLIVTVEPTNACQNNCLYCSRQLMKRKIGYMPLEIMERISAEAGEHGAAIRHGGFGEPLLHPKIVDLIASNKKHDVLTTIFSNCNQLTEDMMRAFVDLGLDEIRFSSSGVTPDEHNAVRKNSNYKRDFDEKLMMAHRIREEMGATRPFLTLYTNVIDYDSEVFKEYIDGYRDHYIQFADKIDIDLTMFSRVKHLDHVKDLYAQQTVNETHKKCVNLFLKLITHYNGDVFACDKVYDYDEDYFLGSLQNPDFTISKGYKSAKMDNLRDKLSFDMRHDDFDLCKDCYSNTTKWDALIKGEEK